MINNLYNIESVEKINIRDIIIYTSTLYDNSKEGKIRSNLAIQLFQNARNLSIKCIVADGGSSNLEYLNKIKILDNVKFFESKISMGQDRVNALSKAINEYPNNKYYLWTEPEKNNLITVQNLSLLVKYANKFKYDIIIPNRKNSNIPNFQKILEEKANNKILKELKYIGINNNTSFDLLFGPKLFTKKGAEFFLNYKGNLEKWDVVIKPVIDALKAGIKVGSVNIDFKYDESQVIYESDPNNIKIKLKRIEQYKEILKELLGDNDFTL